MSFVLLGILNSQAAGAVAGGAAYDLLETTVLGSDTASVSFTGLGSYTDYKHLQIRATARLSSSFLERTVSMRLNGDSGTNYAHHSLFGSGSSVGSSAASSTTKIDIGSTPANNAAADSFAGYVMDFLDPFDTTKNKTVRILTGNTTTPQIRLFSGLYANSNALTSISFSELTTSSNFVTGSRFSLYGIKAA